jgi:hypothetical protein
MADLEANFMHLQLMHESLTRFSESFASFLYGLNMNAFCIDFPEVWTATRCALWLLDIADSVRLQLVTPLGKRSRTRKTRRVCRDLPIFAIVR